MESTNSSAFQDRRTAIGASLIDGGAGTDIRSEPAFETLDAAVRRMESDGPEAVRWHDVARDGLAILETQSKDLLVGVWTTFALARIEGPAGLAVGLAILDGMIDSHWDGLQPPLKRERARVGALEWLVGRLAPIVAKWPNPPVTYPAMVAAYQSLDSIDRMASEKLTKEQVSLGELIRALRPHADEARRALAEIAARAAAPEPTPTAAPPVPVAAPVQDAAPPPSPVFVAPSPAVAPPAPVVSTVGADLNRSLSQLTDAIRTHAVALRQSDLADPRGYILTRTGAWLAIRQAPPTQGGKSALPPPDAARIASVDTLQKGGHYADAVQAAESIVASSPFFIDGNLLAGRALSAMGPGFVPARLAVATATAAFLIRIPELRDLAFSDGRRFVSDPVLTWLEEEGAMGGRGASEADVGDPINALAIEARRIAQDGKPRDGIAHLAAALNATGGGRDRLRIQLIQAQLLVDFDLHAAAWSLLDHLDAEINRRMIDEWEPAIAATASELRLRIGTLPQMARLVPDDRRRVALDEARLRLARCDVTAAVRLLS